MLAKQFSQTSPHVVVTGQHDLSAMNQRQQLELSVKRLNIYNIYCVTKQVQDES